MSIARCTLFLLTGLACSLAGCSALPPAKNDQGQPVADFAVINGEPTPPPSITLGDRATLARLYREGTENSQVLDTLTHLTTQIGPRLTGSSNAEAANRWALERFNAWGLENASLFQWDTIAYRFDRGPTSGVLYTARRARPGDDQQQPEMEKTYDIKALTTLAWVPGTQGPVRGKVVRMPTTEAEFEAVRDSLPGAWVLITNDATGRQGIRGTTGSVNARYAARAEARSFIADPSKRPVPEAIPNDSIAGPWHGALSGGQLGPNGYPIQISITKAQDGALSGTLAIGDGGNKRDLENLAFNDNTLTFEYESPRGRSRYTLTPSDGALTGTAVRTDEENPSPYDVKLSRPTPVPTGPSVLESVLAIGPAGFVSSSRDERVWTSSVQGWRDLTPDTIARDIEVTISEPDYDYINSKLADGTELFAEFDCANTLTPGPIPVYNTIAEIRGSEFPEQVIIVSAHLDSWNGPGSQGATDNGTGSSVTLEAARILAAANARPKRTIRFILWTGEEQGLLGSRAYVESLSEAERANIVACFVDDGGTNYQGGLHAIAPMRDLLAAATAPTNGRFYDETDRKYLNVNLRIEESMPQGGGSDHASFNAIGVPGFFWDETGRADYGFGWHTQHDRVDLAIEPYLIQSATNTAMTAYNLACSPDMLAREGQKEEPADAQASAR